MKRAKTAVQKDSEEGGSDPWPRVFSPECVALMRSREAERIAVLLTTPTECVRAATARWAAARRTPSIAGSLSSPQELVDGTLGKGVNKHAEVGEMNTEGKGVRAVLPVVLK